MSTTTDRNDSEPAKSIDADIVKSTTPVNPPVTLILPVKSLILDNPDLNDMLYICYVRLHPQQPDQLLPAIINLDHGENAMACRALATSMMNSVDRTLPIDCKSFISFDPINVPDYPVATVKVYMGVGRPDGMEAYQRVVCGETEDGRIIVRWSRVEEPQPYANTTDVVDDISRPLQAVQLDDHLIVRINLEVKCERTTLRDLLQLSTDLSNRWGGHSSCEPINAILKAVCSPLDKGTVVHGNKYYPPSSPSNVHIRGVELRKGVIKALRLANNGQNVMLCEKFCSQLFFPATSVADFIEKFTGRQSGLDNTTESERLTSILKGVRVKLLGQLHNYPTSIISVTDTTPDRQKIHVIATGVNMCVRDYYDNAGCTLFLSHMPCITVSSPSGPYPVPAELCSILPDQPFHHAGDPAFQRELAAVSSKIEVRPDLMQSEVSAEELAQGAKDNTVESAALWHYAKCTNWETSRMKPASILLVEIGSSVQKWEEWTQFQQVLRNMSQRQSVGGGNGRDKTPGPIGNVHPEVLKLEYSTHEACLDIWVSKLEKAIAPLLPGSRDKINVAIIFANHNGADRLGVFRLIKAACNHSRIGVQSIGISLPGLRNKMSNDKSLGLLRYCGQILRKMFARTPTFDRRVMPQTRYSVPLAVALHVVPFVRSKGEAPGYLVSLVSREVEGGRQYRTTVKLIDSTAAENDMLGVFQEHMGKHGFTAITAPRQILLLRSGFLLQPAADATSVLSGAVEDAAMDLDNVYDSAHGSIEDDHKSHMLPSSPSDRGPKTTSTPAADHEIMLLTQTLHQLPEFQHTALFPIGVNEEKAYNLQFSQNNIAEHVEQHRARHAHKGPEKPKAVYFTQDLHRISNSDREWAVHLHSAAKNVQTFMKLTMLDRYQEPVEEGRSSTSPIAAPISTPLFQNAGSYSPPAKRFASGSSNVAPFADIMRRSVSGANNGISHHVPALSLNAKPHTVPLRFAVNARGKQQLAHLFHDDHIGLHECKWPIPTYLAKRVVGWALVHMNEKDVRTEADGTVVRRAVMPELHPNRKDMLWYL